MITFETHAEACSYAKRYFSKKFPSFNVKLQTIEAFRYNICISLVSQYALGEGNDTVMIAWIFTYNNVFMIGIEKAIVNYSGLDGVIVNEIVKDFEMSTYLFEKVKLEDEEEYYNILLHSVAKDCVVETSMSTEQLPRPAPSEQTPKIGSRRIPQIVKINSVKNRDGTYSFKADFSEKFRHRARAISVSEGSSAQSKEGNGIPEDAKAVKEENTHIKSAAARALYIEEIARKAVEADKARSSFFPLSELHPKFHLLTPTTQKLIKLKNARKHKK